MVQFSLPCRWRGFACSSCFRVHVVVVLLLLSFFMALLRETFFNFTPNCMYVRVCAVHAYWPLFSPSKLACKALLMSRLAGSTSWYGTVWSGCRAESGLNPEYLGSRSASLVTRDGMKNCMVSPADAALGVARHPSAPELEEGLVCVFCGLRRRSR